MAAYRSQVNSVNSLVSVSSIWPITDFCFAFNFQHNLMQIKHNDTGKYSNNLGYALQDGLHPGMLGNGSAYNIVDATVQQKAIVDGRHSNIRL
jgi:hypothetical protein